MSTLDLFGVCQAVGPALKPNQGIEICTGRPAATDTIGYFWRAVRGCAWLDSASSIAKSTGTAVAPFKASSCYLLYPNLHVFIRTTVRPYLKEPRGGGMGPCAGAFSSPLAFEARDQPATAIARAQSSPEATCPDTQSADNKREAGA